ncbi:hypothetical protein RCL_jg5089.t1 [Rhizophagus clarus]|uniref:Uncharacterized protein n=1 Tax=Rhizophagus clarus TaxID=94130 RepID=A0A8H3L918_9GLOM|nr:hypothetical protein RCL_jg5089.t1 [Rhizophagus clarus]
MKIHEHNDNLDREIGEFGRTRIRSFFNRHNIIAWSTFKAPFSKSRQEACQLSGCYDRTSGGMVHTKRAPDTSQNYRPLDLDLHISKSNSFIDVNELNKIRGKLRRKNKIRTTPDNVKNSNKKDKSKGLSKFAFANAYIVLSPETVMHLRHHPIVMIRLLLFRLIQALTTHQRRRQDRININIFYIYIYSRQINEFSIRTSHKSCRGSVSEQKAHTIRQSHMPIMSAKGRCGIIFSSAHRTLINGSPYTKNYYKRLLSLLLKVRLYIYIYNSSEN